MRLSKLTRIGLDLQEKEVKRLDGGGSMRQFITGQFISRKFISRKFIFSEDSSHISSPIEKYKKKLLMSEFFPHIANYGGNLRNSEFVSSFVSGPQIAK
jgi:hypothetical protein